MPLVCTVSALLVAVFLGLTVESGWNYYEGKKKSSEAAAKLATIEPNFANVRRELEEVNAAVEKKRDEVVDWELRVLSQDYVRSAEFAKEMGFSEPNRAQDEKWHRSLRQDLAKLEEEQEDLRTELDSLKSEKLIYTILENGADRHVTEAKENLAIRFPMLAFIVLLSVIAIALTKIAVSKTAAKPD